MSQKVPNHFNTSYKKVRKILSKNIITLDSPPPPLNWWKGRRSYETALDTIKNYFYFLFSEYAEIHVIFTLN